MPGEKSASCPSWLSAPCSPSLTPGVFAMTYIRTSPVFVIISVFDPTGLV